jgi:hypothetical protein
VLAVLVPAVITWLVIATWYLVLGPRLMEIQPAWGMSDELSPAQELVLFFAVVMGIMINVFLWTTAMGMNQSTEIRSGLAGLVSMVAWLVLVWLVLVLAPGAPADSSVVWPIVFMSPFGPAFLSASLIEARGSGLLYAGILLQAAVAAVLIGVSLARYSRFSVGPRRLPAGGALPTVGQTAELRPPRKSPLLALAWKQWRECLPICAAGLVLILGWTALLVLSQVHRIPHFGSRHFLLEATRTLVELTTGVGPVIALVVGVGAFVAEMQPRLLAFWRSRPVNPSHWFWTKYITGTATILVFLLGPIVLVGTWAWLTGADRGSPGHIFYAAVWSSILLFAFTTAVCLTCVVRQAVYSGILSVGCVLGVLLLPYVLESPSWLRWQALRTLGECLAFASCLGALTVAVLLLAWQSVVRDWGWKV